MKIEIGFRSSERFGEILTIFCTIRIGISVLESIVSSFDARRLFRTPCLNDQWTEKYNFAIIF